MKRKLQCARASNSNSNNNDNNNSNVVTKGYNIKSSKNSRNNGGGGNGGDDDDDFIEDDFGKDEYDEYLKKMKKKHDEEKQRKDQQTKDIAPKSIPCPIHRRGCSRRLTKDKSHYYYKCFIHGCRYTTPHYTHAQGIFFSST